MTIPLPRPLQVKVGLLVSVTFLLATCLYCVSYQAMVISVVPDVSRTVIVAMREWGVWLIFTPWAFRLFDVLDAKALWRGQLLAGILLTSSAALVPVALDQWTGNRGIVASLAIFLPRYAATVLVIHLLWRVLLRPADKRLASRHEDAPAESSASPPACLPATESPATLLVCKGADQCLIRTDEIQFLSAADNYVEIQARDQKYLLRATLAQMENLLPAGHYVRIHRSHIVRIDQIDRIRTERSSKGQVQLRGGRTLPISKNYRQRLLERRPDFGMH